MKLHKIVSGFLLICLLVIGAPIHPSAAAGCNPAPNLDLSNCTYNSLNLTDSDFSGSTLRATNFTGANLTGANFSGANLTGANFSGANLTGANLTGATLGGAGFSFTTNLTTVRSGGLIGEISGFLPSGWFLRNGYFLGKTANLGGKTLSGIDLSGLDLHLANLGGIKSQNLTGNPYLPDRWGLYDGVLVGPYANLTGADFTGTRQLLGADLEGVKSGNIKGTPEMPPGWLLRKGFIIGLGANLTGGDLSDLDLSGMALRNADFTNTNLSNTNLTGANLAGATLTGANLTGANCSDCWLTNVKSGGIIGSPTLRTGYFLRNGYIVGSNVNLVGANLKDQDLTGASLNGANLTGANLTGANLTNVKSGPITGTPTLPTGWILRSGYLFGPGANLSNAYLAGESIDLGSTDMTGANLTGVTSGKITGTPTLPTGWILKNGFLIGPGANLTGANLTGASLSGAKSGGITGSPTLPTGWMLRSGYLIGPGANLSDANLATLDLRAANLDEVVSGNVIGTPTLPTGWMLRNGYLIGPGANLTGANLTGADLGGANLGRATLTGVASGNITGAPTLPTGWTLRNGYLIGPGANLTGANLTGADLANGNLTGATLTGVVSGDITGIPTLPTGWTLRNGFLIGPGANLTGANLTEFNLSGMNLTSADLTGANLNGVSSGNITGTPTLPTGWTLRKGYLIGPGANLTGANLTGANLNGVSSGNITGTPTLPTGWTLRSGYLIGPGANLTGANLTEFNLAGMNLTSTVLTGANLNGVSSGNITGIPTLPTGWMLRSGYLIGPEANLTGANLTGTDLANANLTGTNLNGVSSGNISGTPTLPTGWMLRNGYLIGPGANLTGANLTGADLGGANLGRATLTGVASGNITGTPTLPTGWTLRNGYLIGPGANLTGANLTGADLANGNLTGATLTGVVSGDITGIPTLPTGWTLRNGFLIGPGANLTGADLSQIDLSGILIGKIFGIPRLPDKWRTSKGYLVGPGADLTGADLSGADLRTVDFGSAKLIGTNLENADLSEAILTEVISSSITGNPRLPSTWKVLNGVLTGAKQFTVRPQITVTGSTTVGSILSAGIGTWSPVPTKTTFQWFRNGVLIPGSNNKNHLITPEDLDSQIYVKVTFEKAGYNKTIRSSTPVSGISLGSFSSVSGPTIKGKPIVGQTLTAAIQQWKPSPQISLRWFANNEDTGVTGSSFKIVPELVGKRITVRASGHKAGYLDSTVSSLETSTVELAALTKTAVPKIFLKVGTKFKVGSTLGVSVGAWSKGVSFTYQWIRDGIPITGSTSLDYKLTSEDISKKISIQIVGTLSGFKPSIKISPQSTKILN